MQLGLRMSLFACVLALAVGCGNEKDDKKKDSNKSPNTTTGDQTANTCPNPPNTNAASTQGGMGDIFGQILSNPNLLSDFTKLLGSVFGGGEGDDGGPLGDLLGALQGGSDNIDEITAILEANPDLADQLRGILDGLGTDDGASLALQTQAATPTCNTGATVGQSAQNGVTGTNGTSAQ